MKPSVALEVFLKTPKYSTERGEMNLTGVTP